MKLRIKATILACLAFALAACSTSPPARFFGLSPMALPTNAGEPAPVVVGVGPIDLPDYIKRPQIVTRSSGNEFIVHEYDRWAERLDDAIPRLLATNIDVVSPRLAAIATPYQATVGIDYRLLARILRFDTDADGLAVLEIHWGFAKQGASVRESRRSRYTAQASNPEDPSAIVAALQQTLEACSREMASAIEEAVDQGS